MGPATSARTGSKWQEVVYRPGRGTRCPASLHEASQRSCATAQGQGTGPRQTALGAVPFSRAWRPVSHSVRTGCTRTGGCAHVALQRAWADMTEQLVRVPHPGARPACRGPFPDPGNLPPARPAQWRVLRWGLEAHCWSPGFIARCVESTVHREAILKPVCLSVPST